KVEPVENVAELTLVDPRMRRVRRDDPESFDRSSQDAFDDFGVGEAGVVGNAIGGNAKPVRDGGAMFRIAEVPAAQQIRRVAEQSRTHRIALAGDAVRTRA